MKKLDTQIELWFIAPNEYILRIWHFDPETIELINPRYLILDDHVDFARRYNLIVNSLNYPDTYVDKIGTIYFQWNRYAEKQEGSHAN